MLDSEGRAVTMRGRCCCLGMAIDSCSPTNNVINWECTVEKMKRGDHGYSTLALGTSRIAQGLLPRLFRTPKQQPLKYNLIHISYKSTHTDRHIQPPTTRWIRCRSNDPYLEPRPQRLGAPPIYAQESGWNQIWTERWTNAKPWTVFIPYAYLAVAIIIVRTFCWRRRWPKPA